MKTSHFLFIIAALFYLSGCSEPLRTLIDLGNEQKAQKNFVAQENQIFDLLLREAKKGMIKAGRSKQQIISRYGEPVIVSPGEAEPVQETFLYRRPVEFTGASKVYLDFDKNGVLLAVRIEEPRGE